jgi:hypothetical protein
VTAPSRPDAIRWAPRAWFEGARAGAIESLGELRFRAQSMMKSCAARLNSSSRSSWVARTGLGIGPNGPDGWVWRMADTRPLSDNEADDRLKAALNALGEARGATVAADTALTAARKALSLLSLGLIAAGVKRELKARP